MLNLNPATPKIYITRHGQSQGQLRQIIGGNSYLTKEGFNYSHVNESMSRIATAESLVDYTKALRVVDYPEERKVKGSTNISGALFIQWASKSEDFNKIIFNYKDDAIKLGKAYLIQDSFRLREQVKISGKIEINTTALIDQANTWEEEVMAKWTTRGFAVIAKS